MVGGVAALFRFATGVGKGAFNAAKTVATTKGGKMGAVMIGASTYMGYAGAEDGKKLQGAAKGALEGVLYSYMPQLMIAELASKPLESIGNFYMERMHQGPWEHYNAGRANFGGNFRDTQQAATMRQRALQEMQNSHINARSVLGSEARTYHRSGAYTGRYY